MREENKRFFLLQDVHKVNLAELGWTWGTEVTISAVQAGQYRQIFIKIPAAVTKSTVKNSGVGADIWERNSCSPL